ncbi:double zinc ribbon domain-containing protein [Deinococcus ruber]|uniref:double zinc ribbon domain-containing protein n=1 Tax=Deinococcus ruber TaxID=1848197 RepID=UPI003570DE92
MPERRSRVPSTGKASYRICPRCWRAVPATSTERYCPNDGTPLVGPCPRCHAEIHSPYARFCSICGEAFEHYTEKGGMT